MCDEKLNTGDEMQIISELDLKQIEDDLEKLSPYLWDEQCCYEAIRHVIRNVDHDCYCDKKEDHNYFRKYDGQFIAKAPERIAALVKRVREQEQYIIALEASCKELNDHH